MLRIYLGKFLLICARRVWSWFNNLILGAHLFLGNEAGSGPHQIERMGLGTCIHVRPSLKQGTGIFCGSGRCLWPENTQPDQWCCQWGLGSIW